MSALITSDVLDISAFDDVYKIEIHRDLLEVFYSSRTKFLQGAGIHALAPLLALGEAMPAKLGPLRDGLWGGAKPPVLERAGYSTGELLRRHYLDRPVHHVAGSSFFLVDGNEKKWLIRMSEFCMLGITSRGKVSLIFNDDAFLIETKATSEVALKALLTERFPKKKAGCANDEFATISIWPEISYQLPALFPHFEARSIKQLPSVNAATDSTCVWLRLDASPSPHEGPEQGPSI